MVKVMAVNAGSPHQLVGKQGVNASVYPISGRSHEAGAYCGQDERSLIFLPVSGLSLIHI